MRKVKRLFHTLRYLKPVQLYGRLWFYLYRPKPDLKPGPKIRLPSGKWCKMAHREPSLLGLSLFRFLNEEREILDRVDWNHPDWDKLWLYNLHYFDDLNARGAETRKDWHAALIQKWIEENPPGQGNGWEPYPTSLRAVNWIKWALSWNELPAEAAHSLVVQVRYLSKRLEIHLLGNHLLANAKALLFAGYFFKGPEAEKWKSTGQKLLSRELQEQILPDGGHLERSPMYHSIVLEDILDCLNLIHTFGEEELNLSRLLTNQAISMLVFLRDIRHPDGEIPFFNDSAFNIAPLPAELFRYTERLGVAESKNKTVDNIISKPDFGLWVMKSGDMHVIVDAGKIGPDHLPGHAHCDTLSYEMSVGGRRFIVNSGTFTYEGPERQRFRSTAAHNTVRIDREEQHEIWANFRVARRGYPFDICVEASNDVCLFEAAHNGYERLKERPIHRRKLRLDGRGLRVEDRIEGAGIHQAESFIHLHPDVHLHEVHDSEVLCMVGERHVTIRHPGDCDFRLESGYFSPEFGKKLMNKVIIMEKKGRAPFSMEYEVLF